MKKKILLIIFMVVSSTLLSQTKDRREQFGLDHENSLEITPQKEFFIIDNDALIYRSNDINKGFITDSSLYKQMPKRYHGFWYGGLNLKFFNEDTAIVIPQQVYIDSGIDAKIPYFLTYDKCKTWQKCYLDSTEIIEITDIIIKENGNCWINGVGGKLYFSNDYGKTFILKNPFNDTTDIVSISMQTDSEGVLMTEDSDIFYTKDNFQTIQQIPFLTLVKKCGFNSYISKPRIRIWKDNIIAQVGEYSYYTNKDSISWNCFYFSDYEIKDNMVYCFGYRDTLIRFDNDLSNYKIINKCKYSGNTRFSMTIDDNNVYLSCDINSDHSYIDKINDKEEKKYYLYSLNNTIEEPDKIIKGEKIKIGYNINRNDIFVFDNDSNYWYRENTFCNYIREIDLINDSSFVVFSNYTNYLCSLSTHSYQEYKYKDFLTPFSLSPIKEIKIIEYNGGCIRVFYDSISYRPNKNNTKLVADKIIRHYLTTGEDSVIDNSFNNSVKIKDIQKAFSYIDSLTTTYPTIKDLHITKKDKKQYKKLLDSLYTYDKFYIKYNAKYKNQYYDIVNHLDTITQSILNMRCYLPDLIRYGIEIINEKGEKIKVVNDGNIYFTNYSGYRIDYNNKHVVCYNVFLNDLIYKINPFIRKDENKWIILGIAQYCIINDKEGQN